MQLIQLGSSFLISMVCRGFIEEGRVRKAVWMDGKWLDVVEMSILEEEFWAKDGSK